MLDAQDMLRPASRALPTRRDAWLFGAKAALLRLRRSFDDLADGPARHGRSLALADVPVRGMGSSPLRPAADDDAVLTAGKIQNLRLAARCLNGLVIPAGMTMGFWRQVGRAVARRGFVVGRELREGCLVPSVGGGLCQLSNALYEAALQAGLEIVERHAHSRIVPGSQAARGRDATVFWNYVDLRLRAPYAWRIEVTLDADTLHVVIRADAAGPNFDHALMPVESSAIGLQAQSCHTCGNLACQRMEMPSPEQMHCTWIQLPGEWPEFAAYRTTHCRPGDRFVAQSEGVVQWVLDKWQHWRTRRWPLPQVRMHGAQRLAAKLASALRDSDQSLVIPQSLLVPWWRAGQLGGRRFDVLMTSLPASVLQATLDRACALHSNTATLVDFRADPDWLADETAALARAQKWITPHRGILALAGSRTLELPWVEPCAGTPPVGAVSDGTGPLRVLLPASALARKGVCELRAALAGMDAILLLPTGAQESEGFWEGCRTQSVASIDLGLWQADVVVLPAWVEHQPRGLLLAMARGVPVIATPACGLPLDGRWFAVEPGDIASLRARLEALASARACGPLVL